MVFLSWPTEVSTVVGHSTGASNIAQLGLVGIKVGTHFYSMGIKVEPTFDSMGIKVGTSGIRSIPLDDPISE